MNTTKLINLCRQKNKKAWEIFFKRYSRLIYWTINKRLGSFNSEYQQSDVEDIFQEVFLVLLKKDKLIQLENKKALPGWLAIITSNKVSDYMRKKFRNREDLVPDFPEISDFSFKEKLLNRNTFSLIDKIVENLSSKEKIIFSLNILEEKTHREIAKITSLSINTVSTLIVRTKEKIKKELTQMRENCD